MMAESGQVSKAELKTDLDVLVYICTTSISKCKKYMSRPTARSHSNSRKSKTGNSETSCIKETGADKPNAEIGRKR